MGRARWVVLLAASLTAAALAGGCSGPAAGPDAATVEATFTDAAIFTDSSSACMVTLRPAGDTSHDDRARPGVVLGCPGLDVEPTSGRVQVDPGTYVVEAGQWRCPGMPGECSQDPDDVMYRDAARGGDGSATWSCSVRVDLAARASVIVEVRGTGADDTSCRVR